MTESEQILAIEEIKQVKARYFRCTVHHGHMPEVEVTSPTTARAIFAMEDLIWWPEGSRRRTLHGWGHYQETFEKIDGKWLIKTLKLTRLRVDQT